MTSKRYAPVRLTLLSVTRLLGSTALVLGFKNNHFGCVSLSCFRTGSLLQERESIEEEKAQVDRYKQLLLKQRDIMILLTQRLNERDDQIVALQVCSAVGARTW